MRTQGSSDAAKEASPARDHPSRPLYSAPPPRSCTVKRPAPPKGAPPAAAKHPKHASAAATAASPAASAAAASAAAAATTCKHDGAVVVSGSDPTNDADPGSAAVKERAETAQHSAVSAQTGGPGRKASLGLLSTGAVPPPALEPVTATEDESSDGPRGPGFWITMGPERSHVRAYRTEGGSLVLSMLDCVRVFVADATASRDLLSAIQARVTGCPTLPFLGRVRSVQHCAGEGRSILMAPAAVVLGIFERFWSTSRDASRLRLAGMEPLLVDLRSLVDQVGSHERIA